MVYDIYNILLLSSAYILLKHGKVEEDHVLYFEAALPLMINALKVQM